MKFYTHAAMRKMSKLALCSLSKRHNTLARKADKAARAALKANNVKRFNVKINEAIKHEGQATTALHFACIA